MQYNVNTPAEYLAALEPDWRKDSLLALRDLIRTNDPTLSESIAYKMLAYGAEGQAVFHLNAQKNYVSLYVGDTKKIDPAGELLAGLDLGKGCIRFKKSQIVRETRIGEFIAQTIAAWRAGADVGC